MHKILSLEEFRNLSSDDKRWVTWATEQIPANLLYQDLQEEARTIIMSSLSSLSPLSSLSSEPLRRSCNDNHYHPWPQWHNWPDPQNETDLIISNSMESKAKWGISRSISCAVVVEPCWTKFSYQTSFLLISSIMNNYEEEDFVQVNRTMPWFSSTLEFPPNDFGQMKNFHLRGWYSSKHPASDDKNQFYAITIGYNTSPA